MNDDPVPSVPELLAARVEIPEHVVMRSFEQEVVVLNLESGGYHGLNPVAARMFEAVREARSAGVAVEALMAEYGQTRDVIEGDLADLLRGLSERGLIVLGPPGG